MINILKKMKVGSAVLLICVGVSVNAKEKCYSTEDFYKKFPEYDHRIKGEDPTDAERREIERRYAEYTGAFWCQNCLGGCHSENVVPAGVADWGVHFGCGYGEKAIKHTFKIIVHQKNPCFIVGKTPHPKATIRKIDDHTVEIIGKKEDWCDLHLSNYGRKWTDHKYNQEMPQKSLRDNKAKIKNLLGKNLSCVDEDNVERWEIFTKGKDGWKPFATETFYIKKGHKVLR